jgi:hypothetical protein
MGKIGKMDLCVPMNLANNPLSEPMSARIASVFDFVADKIIASRQMPIYSARP